jgi:exodeoxyribonuclease V alpha subunit
MTIHKSQGSEFDRVIVVLPPERSRILARELLYTGITRARQQVEIWATRKSFLEAAGKPLARASGLRDVLWRE